jgi:hypothetical protein
VLFDRNYEDAYTDPGSPATARTPLGTYTLAQLAGPGRRLLLQVRQHVSLLHSFAGTSSSR